MRRLLLPLLLASLAACTLSLPAKAPPNPAGTAAAPPPLSIGSIEVTSLDTPPSAPARTAPASPAKPRARPATLTTPPAAATEARPARTEVSPEALACQAKGGTWSATGASPLRTCIEPTRDAGKSCRKQSDCDGLCLARSRTCAPVKPLFGCNPILQDDGTEATLCID